MRNLLPFAALLATLLVVQSPASRACSTLDYANAVIDFANFLSCSNKDPADIQDFFETEGIEELVDCINTDDVTAVNASCVSAAAEQILDDFGIDSFFDELQNISAALDLPCSCTYELENIDSDCLDDIGDQYGTPSMSTTVEYLEQVCDVFDYMEDCAFLEDAQDECMEDFDTMSEMCEFYIVPINEPSDLIDMMDRDDDDSGAIKYGCTFVMNMAVRMPDSFVSDCEASNPSLNMSRLQEVCEPYTTEPDPTPAPTYSPTSAPTAFTSGAIYEVSCQSSFSLNSTSNETLSDTEKNYLATVFAESSQLVDSPDDVRVQGKRSSSAVRRVLLSGGNNNFVVTFTFNVSSKETNESTFTNAITDELLVLFNSTEFEETLTEVAQIQGVDAGKVNVQATEELVADSVTAVVVVIVTEAPTTAPSFVPTAAPTTLPTADSGGRDDDDDDFPYTIVLSVAFGTGFVFGLDRYFRRSSARGRVSKNGGIELEVSKVTQNYDEADQQDAPQPGPETVGQTI